MGERDNYGPWLWDIPINLLWTGMSKHVIKLIMCVYGTLYVMSLGMASDCIDFSLCLSVHISVPIMFLVLENLTYDIIK